MLYQFEHFGISEYFCKEYGENFSFPLHLHNSFEFVTITDGSMVITIDDKEYVLEKGDSVFIFPNQLHSFQSRGSKHMLCIFSPELVKAYASMVAEKTPVSNTIAADTSLIDALDRLPDNSTLIEKKGLLYSLCAGFDKNTEYLNKEKCEDNLLYRIFEFVELNYINECSLSDLSHEMGYSYSYISRSFKKLTGVSFNSYVNHYRISKACYLLNNSDISVLECALESGYTSLRSFNRNFYMCLGLSPTEYRQTAKLV